MELKFNINEAGIITEAQKRAEELAKQAANMVVSQFLKIPTQLDPKGGIFYGDLETMVMDKLTSEDFKAKVEKMVDECLDTAAREAVQRLVHHQAGKLAFAMSENGDILNAVLAITKIQKANPEYWENMLEMVRQKGPTAVMD